MGKNKGGRGGSGEIDKGREKVEKWIRKEKNRKKIGNKTTLWKSNTKKKQAETDFLITVRQVLR